MSMTQEEFDSLYPHGSLIRQEKIAELEAATVNKAEPVVVEEPPETPIIVEPPANPAGGSDIPESVWRAG